MHDSIQTDNPGGSKSLSAKAETSAIPFDFGVLNGTEVSNKDAIFDDIDRCLGRSKPPDVEYIMVHSFARVPIFPGLGLALNYMGHAAVKYRLPNGEQYCMNISGKSKHKGVLVSLMRPENYFFSTNAEHFEVTASQRGLYNRDITTVRVEDVPGENILAMHQYFLKIRDEDVHGEHAKFHMFISPISNFLRNWIPLPFEISERGNCARWTSEGLLRAGVVTHKSMFPKSIWINMFENSRKTAAKSPDNVNVVHYKRIRHAKLTYGKNLAYVEAVAPLQSLRSLFYYDLSRFANAVVEVPESGIEAVVHRQEHPSRPSRMRNIVNNKLFIGSSAFLTFLLIRIQLRRFGRGSASTSNNVLDGRSNLHLPSTAFGRWRAKRWQKAS